ncbi:MAG: hypothetical protein O3A00_09295 [Planctomycetota bacterium]|nr:hypothetical protein [Planctomycetota bacterium]
MNPWMMFWYGLLGFTTIAFLGLVIVVGSGAIAELRETLNELRDQSR